MTYIFPGEDRERAPALDRLARQFGFLDFSDLWTTAVQHDPSLLLRFGDGLVKWGLPSHSDYMVARRELNRHYSGGTKNAPDGAANKKGSQT